MCWTNPGPCAGQTLGQLLQHPRQERWSHFAVHAGSSSRLVIPVHATASGRLEAEGFLGAVVQPGKRHATPAYLQGLQANVTSTLPAHMRLYQVPSPLLACHACRATGCWVCRVTAC